jgi:hypothetical protein
VIDRSTNYSLYFFGVIFFFIFTVPFLHGYSSSWDDWLIDFSIRYRPESFYGNNTALLRNCQHDTIFYSRHTLDYGIGVSLDSIVQFNTTFRSKGVWGGANFGSSTSYNDFKFSNTVLGNHDHNFPRHLIWAREMWFEFSWSDAFDLSPRGDHYFKIGIFPFALGRGIALGSAFAVGQESLGFFSDASIDKYASGALFHGDLIKDYVSYGFYAALVRNMATSFKETSAKVLAQKYGGCNEFIRRKDPARGFGKINYIAAAHINWYVFNDDTYGTLILEPYGLYNYAPEQQIEFIADANSKLTTLGFAAEYATSRFEFGFDCAANLGRQAVFGWDRNHVQVENRDSVMIEVNSHVLDQDGNKIPFVVNSDAQKIIFNAQPGMKQNGQEIGMVDSVGFLQPNDGVAIVNAENRFRDPYKNSYHGFMFVADTAIWLHEKDLSLVATAGYASGDNNPNFDCRDEDFDGFIGLQEIYSGKRVKSAFFLSGAGKVGRPIANPLATQRDATLSKTVSGFTNIAFIGGGLNWTPLDWNKPFTLHPNVLAYWQPSEIPGIDENTGMDRGCADKYLGIEINLFTHVDILKNLRLFFVGSIFVPGQFYSDIKGRRIILETAEFLDREDTTGFAEDEIPKYGDDIAFTFNLGLEWRF